MSSTTRFIVVSLLFHLLYTASIFDIYFTSPVVHPSRRFSARSTYHLTSVTGQQHAHAEHSDAAAAKRLVLIVGDGLRADTLFKLHAPTLLPAWAADEVHKTGRISTETALQSSKNWTCNKDFDRQSHASFDAAPHLRQIALQRGAWGVSHTRVPTESRPGHVALIAGMYEDVSAVTKGWKLNPVSFDSVFNQSSHTFSFGSPDILPMFAVGASPPNKVDMESYPEEAEDFTADASQLDVWVLRRLEDLLRRATSNTTLNEQLRAPQTVFFLHLLGLDTTGHTYRPHSAEYVGNLMVVDAIVAQVERLFAAFYGNEQSKETAFVFTADHGMSNKGNHGDGEPDNTRTPLIAWGAGVRGPRRPALRQQRWRETERDGDEYFQGWEGLDDVWRADVEQADITPLMSTLLGSNMPANSEGKLPLDYVDIPQEHAARAMVANALEVLEVYRVKHEQRKGRMLHYVPYGGLPASSSQPDSPGADVVNGILDSLNAGHYDDVVADCETLIREALRGASYLQTYDWLLLVSIIVIGYVGSIAYSATFLLRHYVLQPEALAEIGQKRKRQSGFSIGRVFVGSTLALLWSKFAAERSPWTYYLYAAFAAYYWIRVADEGLAVVVAWRLAEKHMKEVRRSTRPRLHLSASVAMRVVLSLAALEVMVTGYVQRLAWTGGFIFLGLVWPAFGMMADFKSRHEILIMLWFATCAWCGSFTLSNVEKEESIPHLVVSGLLFLVAGAIILWRPMLFLSSASTSKQGKENDAVQLKRTVSVLLLQLGVLVVSTLVSASSSSSLQRKEGLPRLNQVVAWGVLLVCFTVPFTYGFRRRTTNATRQPPSHRLTIVVFAFAPLFVLLSIRDETLFFGCFTMTLLAWAKLEASLYEERLYQRNVEQHHDAPHSSTPAQPRRRALEKEDVRVAVCFLFFLHVGFFGTGNVASISSFYLSPVYRLVPIFSPFLMAALLIVKILVPFVVLAAVLQMLCLTPPHAARTVGTAVRRTGAELNGPPLWGVDAVGGLGMRDAYAMVLLACLFTDVLALNFLLTVRTQGSWLEIGQTITHFAMSNLLQVFMLALAGAADVVVGRGGAEGT